MKKSLIVFSLLMVASSAWAEWWNPFGQTETVPLKTEAQKKIVEIANWVTLYQSNFITLYSREITTTNRESILDRLKSMSRQLSSFLLNAQALIKSDYTELQIERINTLMQATDKYISSIS